MSTRTHALRNTLFASVGIYTEYFLGMVAAVVIARHLGPASYGVYGLFIWFAAVGIVVTNSGITTGVIKFIAELRGANDQAMIVPLLRHLRGVQAWHMGVVIAAGALVFTLAGHRLAPSLNLPELLLLGAAVSLRAPYMFNIAIAKGFEAFDAVARIAMIGAPLNLALVVGVTLVDGSIRWFVVVYALASTAFFLSSRYYARVLVKNAVSDATAASSGQGTATDPLPAALLQRVRRHLRLVSATVIIGYLMSSGIEVLFLNFFKQPAAAGQFKVAYQLAEGISLLIPGVFSAVLLPMMARALSEGAAVAGRRFAAATAYLVLLAAPMVAFGVVFAGAVIALLYGSAYAQSGPVFALFLLVFAVSTVSQAATSLLVSADRQHMILWLTIGFGLLKITLDVVLIQRYGLAGAAAVVTFGSILHASVYIVLASRISAVSLDHSRLLRILTAALLAALAGATVHWLGLAPLWTIAFGALVVGGVYAPAVLLLGGLDRADIGQLRELHHRVSAGRPLAFGRLLSWAQLRARSTP